MRKFGSDRQQWYPGFRKADNRPQQSDLVPVQMLSTLNLP